MWKEEDVQPALSHSTQPSPSARYMSKKAMWDITAQQMPDKEEPRNPATSQNPVKVSQTSSATGVTPTEGSDTVEQTSHPHCVLRKFLTHNIVCFMPLSFRVVSYATVDKL